MKPLIDPISRRPLQAIRQPKSWIDRLEDTALCIARMLDSPWTIAVLAWAFFLAILYYKFK